MCANPPEYCQNDKKDFSECKAWVLANHPDLHNEIYGEPEVKEEGKEGDEVPKQIQKKKKKISIATITGGEIRVIKTKRGMKKTICTVLGLQNYGVSLKDAAKIMGKKFACGAAVGDDEKHGECITI